MHVPTAFAMEEEDAWGMIGRHPFGVLVTVRDGLPFGTHLPFVRDGDALVGHLARANPQAMGLDGAEALAVFSGPHAYVSPAWYGDGPAVPTWNYEAVHAYGAAGCWKARS
ncbi:MAG: FMN-binding negative transcriptional regulator [Gemmataceae bacterium]|nr:FMN-binding negative transcriptional regulator [Gemmataceae bacterium]